jgi:hypothetical protein
VAALNGVVLVAAVNRLRDQGQALRGRSSPAPRHGYDRY